MASLINVVNHTCDGNIQALTIPKAVSVAIRPRTGTCLIYDAAAGSDYWTIAEGAMLSVTSANMEGSTIYLKGTAAAVVEVIYQTKG